MERKKGHILYIAKKKKQKYILNLFSYEVTLTTSESLQGYWIG